MHGYEEQHGTFAQGFDPQLPPDPERPPSHGRRVLRRLGTLLLLALALGVIVGLGAVGWLLLGGGGESVEPGQDVRVTIPQGADAAQVAELLEQAGVVGNATIFRIRLRVNGDGGEFRAGSYAMKTGWSYDDVVQTLNAGPPAAPTFQILIPEGFRISEVVQRVEGLRSETSAEGGTPLPAFTAEQYRSVVDAARVPAEYEPPPGTTSIEGFLFPATYELRHSASAQDLLDRQLEAFAENFATLDLTRARAANLTPYEVVVIASLVEREAQLPEERPLVAAVIWNRLQEGMTLGIDATIQYAVDPDEWVTELRQSHLEIDSPYNSRTNAGLPPTPIANPGLSSLQAAANPAEVDYLYYVANPDGSGEHFFTNSYDEFLAHPFQQY